MGKKKTKIAGIKVGKKVGPGELRKIAAAKNISVAQAAAKASNKAPLSSAAKKYLPAPAPPPPPPPTTTTTTTTNNWGGSTESQIPYSEYSLFGDTFSAQIQNQGLEAVERIRQAGATERLKYEVDNKIPEIQAESKGRIDLQGIINAGMKNIANIERGSDMVRNITSMFSF